MSYDRAFKFTFHGQAEHVCNYKTALAALVVVALCCLASLILSGREGGTNVAQDGGTVDEAKGDDNDVQYLTDEEERVTEVTDASQRYEDYDYYEDGRVEAEEAEEDEEDEAYGVSYD